MTPSPKPARVVPASRSDTIATVLLVLVVLLVFARAAGFAFVPWDDPDNVYENFELGLPLAASLAAAWRHPIFASYVPVTRSVWSLVWHASRAPAGFHLLNVALHALNTVLAFRILRRVGLATPAAAIGAALFAVHPLQVEPVAWVTGLKDVLGGTCGLVALVAFLRWAPAGRPAAGAAPAAVLACVAYGAALLAKSSSATVPLLAAALGLALGAPRRRLALTLLVGLGMALPVVLATRGAETALGRPFVAVPPLERVRVALDALGFYLTRLVAPFDLSLDHGRTPAWVIAHPGSWAVAAVPIALAIALVVTGRRQPRLALAAALFAGALLPVLGLVPFLHQNISTVADRYAYVAMLGPALALGVAWTGVRGSAVRAGMLGALVAAALASTVLLGAWRDGDALFTHVLERNPASWLAHNNRGVRLGQEGHAEAAERDLRAALALEPGLPEAHGNLGNVLYLRGQADSAAAEWRTAIRLLPTLAMAHRNLGQWLAMKGDTAEAVTHLREAMRLTPGDAVSAGALRALGAPAPAPPGPR